LHYEVREVDGDDDDDDDDLLGLAARGWITMHTYIHTVKEN